MNAPEATPETQQFWDSVRDGRLMIQRCDDCARYYFYPRRNCRYCASPRTTWTAVSGRAKLISFIIDRRPVEGAAGASPVIALVELEEGVTMMSNIVDVDPTPENLTLDMLLMVAYRTVGETMLPVFVPVGDAR